MNSDPSGPRAVRFGVFEVDLAAGELRKRGRRVKIEAQPFQVLGLLVRRAGELVTRDELRNELWPEDTFVEFDHSLNTAVKKIRQALDDSARNPRYVETVPRQGYRFVAAVDEPAAPAESAPVVTSTPQPDRRPVRWYIFGALMVVVLVLAAAAVYSISRSSDGASPPALTPVPLTSYPGWESQPSFSPDGSQVAFAWNGMNEDNFDIYVKVVGTEDALPLTGFPGEEIWPAWSPDNRYIAFLRRLKARSGTVPVGIFLTSPVGGEPRELTRIFSDARFFSVGKMSWSPDGEWLAFAGALEPSEPPAIHLVSPETREVRRVTTPEPGSVGHSSPSMSPDGSQLAFTVRGTGIFITPLDYRYRISAKPRKLSEGSSFTWLPDGRELLFRLRARPGILRRMKVAGSGELRDTPFSGGSPDISRTANRLAFAQTSYETSLRRIAIPRPGEEPVPQSQPGEKFAPSTIIEEQPRYSPDGSKIAFVSWRSGQEVWVCNSDGSNPTQLTFEGGAKPGQVRWHPDGRRILFTRGGRPTVFAVDVQGGAVETFMEDASGVPVWSADGEWVYFTAGAGGEPQVMKQRTGGGQPVPLVQGQLVDLSADGETLFFFKESGASLWRVPADGGEEVEVLPSVWNQNCIVVDEGIYFIPGGGFARRYGARKPGEELAGASIQFLDFKTGKTRVLAELDRSASWGMTVSPDQQWLIYPRWDHLRSDLMLVEDFR